MRAEQLRSETFISYTLPWVSDFAATAFFYMLATRKTGIELMKTQPFKVDAHEQILGRCW